jgi:Tol biopolymer transport system component
MSLAPGTRLGPYEIVSPLGAGGMGEVYRARDTRLGREVAVKVLPAHLSSSPQVRARFEREARAISSLNHPNICTLHDVGRDGDTEFLVMELIEGETLAQRLLRGALPLADVLRLGGQIASALDRAHRAGVVHRDLKPGNVMLTKTGAKLMDFGLAKGMGASSSPALTMAPTATSPLTADGAIVGTFQYMSPEQLEGEEADARSDLFALGLVLYEMATGRRAFEGRTQASLVAAILKEEPKPIRSYDALSPPALERLVGQCLRKDPDARLQSAHDVMLRLEEIAEGEAAQPARSVGTAQGRTAWFAAALATLAAIGAVTLLLRKKETPASVLIASIPPGDGIALDLRTSGIALSPDGSRLAYVAAEGATAGLWVRPLAAETATRVVDSDDVNCVAWSPDSRWLTYLTHGRLMKIELQGGQAEPLASLGDCLGLSWGTDGWIYYVSNRYLPVTKVAATGGAPVPIPIQGKEAVHRMYTHPSLLPDGRHILYTASVEGEGNADGGVFVATTDGKDEKRVLSVLSNAQYVEPGWLLYARQGSLRAQAFDAASQEVRGDPVPLSEGLLYLSFSEGHMFTVNQDMLVYVRGGGLGARQFTWVDRKGNILGTVGKPGNLYTPRLSHDGRRLAYDMSEIANDNGDIWVHDLERDIPTRLTFDPRNESAPIWSPDDRRLVFFANFPGRSDLFSIPSDGTGSAEPLFRNEAENCPTDWSSDGSIALTTYTTGSPNLDLLIYSTADRKASPWIATSFVEQQARFSPDRKWVSYASDESGRMEVYVRRFAGEGKWRVSSEGGHSPVWRRDGREIFYISPDKRLMSVPVTPGPEFRGGTPVALFRMPNLFYLTIVTQYDVSPDGQRFLMNLEQSQGAPTMTLVSNWKALLKPR